MHGAAHGVWKETTARAVDGREEICEWKADSSVISVMVDMTNIKGMEFKAGSLVRAKSPLIVVLLTTPSGMTAIEYTGNPGLQMMRERAMNFSE